MSLHEKFIPSFYVKNIKLIDYKFLKEKGIKALFFDLDNTIIAYDVDVISSEDALFFDQLAKDFKIVILSNAKKKRAKKACINMNVPYIAFAKKPFKFGFKKALKLVSTTRKEVAVIGDQLATDVYGANRMKFKYTILVDPVKKKSDHFLTKFNRFIANLMIKKIKKKKVDRYNAVLKDYVEKR